jgi:hypothetical protein
MNAAKLMANKWVLVLGVAVVVGVMTNVSLADQPRHAGFNDGSRGSWDGGRSWSTNRDRDGDHSRGFTPSWGGGREQFGRPVYVTPPVNYRPPVSFGGYGNGCVRPVGYGSTFTLSITIVIR